MTSAITFIQKELEREISRPFNEIDIMVQCGMAPLSIIRARPDDVLGLAHKHLHSFPYENVPECWRLLYTEAALWKAVNLSPEDDLDTKFVEILDMAIILTGGAHRQALIHDMFSLMGQNDVSVLSRNGTLSPKEIGQPQKPIGHKVKRQKVSHDPGHYSNIPQSFPKSFLKHNKLDHPVLRKDSMTLTSFQAQLDADHQRNHRQGALPFIITKAITHWPALSSPKTSWNNPQYWLKTTLGGRRLVPVEIGRAYTDDDWSQKIIPFGNFMKAFLLPNTQLNTSQAGSENRGTGYLAQHDLFAQIPSLRADILIPDFCYSSSPSPTNQNSGISEEEEEDASDEPAMNIWLGPASTTSPLHTDPHHNILAQVFGYKYVRLYAPSQAGSLYPRSRSGDVDMSNTSKVDVGLGMEIEGEGTEDHRNIKEQFEKEFPLFKDAEYVEGILGPGECLFIPRGWWHYVKSLSSSCSVSFWWD
jgi:hypothetical protein